MTTKPEAPADTSMMRIVHRALRRDLHRAEIALNGNWSRSNFESTADLDSAF